MKPLSLAGLLAVGILMYTPAMVYSENIVDDIDIPDQAVNSDPELEFIENQGQIDDPFHFYTRGSSRVAFKDDSIMFVEQSNNKINAFEMNFVGARGSFPEGSDITSTNFNYLIGRDQSKWVSGISSFRSIKYENLYAGIDMKVSSIGATLKYDLILKPLSPVEEIKISFEGVKDIDVHSEKVEIILPNDVIYEEKDLFVYYQDNGERIEASFKQIDQLTYGYDLGDYDRTRSVVIDPVVFSTYLGGSTSDHSEGIVMDDQGNSYVTGQTSPWDFPLTAGSYQTDRMGGLDAFVAKFNPDGTDLDFCTLIGGEGDDTGFEIERDGNGNIIVAGRTTSTDIPTHGSAYDDTIDGGWDVFLIKLNPTGTDLLTATYYGGAGTDAVVNLVVDGTGYCYIGGWTSSEDLPITNNNIDDDYSGGDISAFLFKINPMMSQLSYSTYISTAEDDRINGLDVDEAGNAYITGMTRSDEFPLSSDPLDSTYEGSSECFFMKINSNCNQILYSSFLGGSDGEGGYGLELDSDGNIWLTGITYSDGFPATSGVYQTTNKGGGDIFVTQLNGTDFTIMKSTFIGGSSRDGPIDMVLDPFNRVTIVGDLSSMDFPVTSDAIQSVYKGGSNDGFVVSISYDLKDLLYSTYIGGDGWFDATLSVYSDPNGHICFTGWTDNASIPTSLGAYDRTHNGFEDAYIMGLSLDTPPTIPRNFKARTGGGFVEMTWTDPDDHGSQDLAGFQLFKLVNATGIIETIDLGLVNIYNDTDVVNGNEYKYWLRASNLAVNSLPTGVISVIPLDVPSAPLGFDVISGIKMITIEWSPPLEDGGTFITGFVIEKEWNDTEMVSIHFGPGEFELVDQDVIAGIEYNYCIRAINIVGRSEQSVHKTGIAKDVPTSPRNLTAVSGDEFNQLTWEKPENSRGSIINNFNLYRIMEEDQARLLKVLGPNSLSYNDTQVINGIGYSYYITAVNQIGESIPSETILAVPMCRPSIPLFFKVHAGNGEAIIEWERPINDGGSPITGYEILRKISDLEVRIEISDDVFTYVDGGLENGLVHSYSLRAVSDVGKSDWTDQIEVIPLTIPSTPELKLISNSDQHVLVRWNEVNNTGGSPIIGYRIYRYQSGDPLMIAEVDASTFEFNDTKILPRLEYAYIVSAYNIHGESDLSKEIRVMTYGIPSEPLDPIIQQGDGILILSWVGPISDGGSPLIAFIIERIEIESGDLTEIEVDPGTVPYEDLSVVPGKEYQYSISAKNQIGTGPSSDQIKSYAFRIPYKIESFEVVRYKDRIELTWDQVDDEGTGEMKIIIERSVDGGDFFQIVDLESDVSLFIDKNVRSGVEYNYRIYTSNDIGASEHVQSSEISLINKDEDSSSGSIILMIVFTLIPLIIAIILIFLALKKKVSKSETQKEEGRSSIESEIEDLTVTEVNLIENDVQIGQLGTSPIEPEPYEMVDEQQQEPPVQLDGPIEDGSETGQVLIQSDSAIPRTDEEIDQFLNTLNEEVIS